MDFRRIHALSISSDTGNLLSHDITRECESVVAAMDVIIQNGQQPSLLLSPINIAVLETLLTRASTINCQDGARAVWNKAN